MDPASGRGWARVEDDTMRGKLFIHQGDESSFTAKRQSGDRKLSGSNRPLQPPAAARAGRVPTRRRGARGRGRAPKSLGRWAGVYVFRRAWSSISNRARKPWGAVHLKRRSSCMRHL
jgi:hypothetical protein